MANPRSRPGLGHATPSPQEPDFEIAKPPSAGAEEDEEEDYLSMAIAEPVKPIAHETFSERRARQKRETADPDVQAEDRARPPSKHAVEADARTRREEALATALPASSRGFRMLAKLGFEPGMGLGRQSPAPAATTSTAAASTAASAEPDGAPPRPSGPRLEPLMIETKVDRGGIGLDDARKRKVRAAAAEPGALEDAAAAAAKRARVQEDPLDYRARVGREREALRLEKLVGAATRLAEELDAAPAAAPAAEDVLTARDPAVARRAPIRRLRDVNVLYRALERDRREKEREQEMQRELLSSLSRAGGYAGDPEADGKDRLALGTEVEELDEEDAELEAFEALPPEERLGRLVGYLREKHWYCFWCKSGYESAEMDGCPGETEEDHD